MYRGRLASANLDLTDIERIEVLRGPQATLYGRNTIAGAIKIITRTPGDERWADGQIGFGRFDTFQASGSVGGPIEEGALAGSIAFSYDNRNEGWVNNIPTGEDVGEYDNKAARAKLHWYGTEGFDATLSLFAVDANNDGYTGIPYVPFNPPGSPGTPQSGFYDNYSQPGADYGSTSQVGGTLDMTFDLNANIQLRSITSVVQIDDDFGFDISGGGAPGGVGLLIQSSSDMQQTSQEFQLLGTSFDDKLEWIGGLYYLHEDGDQQYNGMIPTIFAFQEPTESDTKSYAFYVEGTYNITERLSATIGGRYTKDEKTYVYNCSGVCTVNGAFAPSANERLDETFDEITPKVGIQYEIGENWLSYASVSKGFQAGGFQTLCFGNADCAGVVYDPQKVWSYEVGFKGDLFDDTLRLNGALFYAAYEDLQQTAPAVLAGNVAFPTLNVGDVDVTGVELEAIWSPIDSLNFFANIGFMDSDKVEIPNVAVRELPSNPEWSSRAGFDYTWSLTGDVNLFFGADVNYIDEYYSEVTNALLVSDYTRINGFIGVGSPDGKWQVIATGKNLTDEDDIVSGLVVPGTTNVRTVLPPTEYMVTLKVKY